MIAMFDSGVGGLSILREIRGALPTADIVYFADTANVPYGGRPQTEIRQLALNATQRLLTYAPDLLVAACNTATSVAIEDLRSAYPKVPIVGVVPVVKTVAETTKNGRVAVVATPATLSSAAYAKLKVDFAPNLEFLEIAAPELVMAVESGQVHGVEAEAMVEPIAKQIQAFGADTVALGSTHFPWLRSVFEAALPGVIILDSGPAVARQVVRVLTNNGKLPGAASTGQLTFLASADPERFSKIASQLFGEPVQASLAPELTPNT